MTPLWRILATTTGIRFMLKSARSWAPVLHLHLSTHLRRYRYRRRRSLHLRCPRGRQRWRDDGWRDRTKDARSSRTHQRQNLKTTSANQSAGTLTLMTSQRQHLSFSVLMWGWISNATEALNEKETRVTRGVTSATESEQVQRKKHGGRFRNSNDGSFSLL